MNAAAVSQAVSERFGGAAEAYYDSVYTCWRVSVRYPNGDRVGWNMENGDDPFVAIVERVEYVLDRERRLAKMTPLELFFEGRPELTAEQRECVQRHEPHKAEIAKFLGGKESLDVKLQRINGVMRLQHGRGWRGFPDVAALQLFVQAFDAAPAGRAKLSGAAKKALADWGLQ